MITDTAGMERYCRSKEILLVIKHFMEIAHADKKAFKQDTKEKHAKSIHELFSLSQGVNPLKRNLTGDQAFRGDHTCR